MSLRYIGAAEIEVNGISYALSYARKQRNGNGCVISRCKPDGTNGKIFTVKIYRMYRDSSLHIISKEVGVIEIEEKDRHSRETLRKSLEAFLKNRL